MIRQALIILGDGIALIAACALAYCLYAAVEAACARLAAMRRRRHEDRAHYATLPCHDERPAAASTQPPGPVAVPRHRTGPLVAITREWACGCEITGDGTGRIVWAKPCPAPLDQEIKDLLT